MFEMYIQGKDGIWISVSKIVQTSVQIGINLCLFVLTFQLGRWDVFDLKQWFCKIYD